MSALKVGDIVRVKTGRHTHSREQGQIVGFDKGNDDGEVRVWFGRETDFLVPHHIRKKFTSQFSIESPGTESQETDLRTWDYPAEDLEVCPAWDMKNLAERYFTGMWMRYQNAPDVFVAGEKDCAVEGCAEKTAARIVFNIWGSVCWADVCSTHTEYDKKAMDDFPWKKRDRTAQTV